MPPCQSSCEALVVFNLLSGWSVLRPSSRLLPAQVYIPFVNYLLMCLCIIIIVIFQTSDRLGQAYGAPWLLAIKVRAHCQLA